MDGELSPFAGEEDVESLHGADEHNRVRKPDHEEEPDGHPRRAPAVLRHLQRRTLSDCFVETRWIRNVPGSR